MDSFTIVEIIILLTVIPFVLLYAPRKIEKMRYASNSITRKKLLLGQRKAGSATNKRK
ncbi:hypothetical protein [Bacillus taeanensis]|uniref:hypothetical protein n=1 Tax=Bacillus taeanensis TaxID=273032 RepID=UPI0015F0306A|nr:hypothetical protein [Bacillus taeanensis]